MKRFLAFALIALCACTAGAQPNPTTPPTLTDVQKLTLLTTVQRFEIAQLRAQAAQRELQTLLKSLEIQGFTFDLQTMSYSPAATGEQKK